ncbi:50S ribosomal protein L25 [Iamia majanohamensis]|uniref:Large ribosomal subunit protein bL25 n=1 Tax=Iamia majanohamensis TaxID=467976 RepID=A0AAE9YC22_9ACTN|nr:50S ribosomal protein L25 [Iamia majanohamensis]WCO68418.1 50S ribosomal protein L25 [Iamia majanohamensis]
MAEITLTATPGRETGTRSSRRLRAEAKVPAVVYGLGRDTVAVTVDWRELRSALITDAGINALIDLTVEGEGESNLAIIKDMQRHPISHTVDHVDFLLIRRDQELAVDVPVVLEGVADEVENNQGLVEQSITLLTVNALPESIPDQLTYDISEMEIGDTVTVGDLTLPSGVTTDVEPDEVVASAQVSRAAIEAEAEEAELAEMAELNELAEAGVGEGDLAEGEGGSDEGDEG